MSATATLERPKDGFLQTDTQAFTDAWKDVIALSSQTTLAITRAQSLQANVGQMGQIFALDRHDLPQTFSVYSMRSHEGHLLRDIVARQTAETPASTTLISWLLDFNAWGDETERLKAAVKVLLTLKRGWDGYDAEPIDPVSARNASAFIDFLGERAKYFEPFADPNGLVGLEAHRNKSAAYLSFLRDGLIAYMIRAGNAIHRGNKASPETVKRVLDALF